MQRLRIMLYQLLMLGILTCCVGISVASVQIDLSDLGLFGIIQLSAVVYIIVGFTVLQTYPLLAIPRVGQRWRFADAYTSNGTENASISLETNVRFVVRIVTRGQYPNLLAKTVKNAYEAMVGILPSEQFSIEVVTDTPLPNNTLPEACVMELLVPTDYDAGNGTLFKARALHYAIEHSIARPQDWILHLDEESHITSGTVRACLEHISTEQSAPRDFDMPAIGQGVLIYARGEIDNLLTTMADFIRVGDDMARFRFQYVLLNSAILGMHGSFYLVENRVESGIGMNFGPDGNLAEDMYFALKACELGVRTKLIESYVFEKSPFTILDFVRQRQRWAAGIDNTTWSKGIPFRYRAGIIFYTTIWPTSMILSIMLPYTLISDSWILAISGAYFFGGFLCLYITGYLITWPFLNRAQRFLIIPTLALTPVFLIMEMIGMIAGSIFRPRNFHVIEKEAQDYMGQTDLN